VISAETPAPVGVVPFLPFLPVSFVAFGALEAVISAHECASYPALAPALIIAPVGSTNESSYSLLKIVDWLLPCHFL
jgi:hypothetical protein